MLGFKIDKGSGGQHDNHNVRTNYEESEAIAERSLHAVMQLLSLTADDETTENAMLQLGLSAHAFVEPLGKHEVQLLGCALYMEKRRKALTYLDVLEITEKFSGRAMNLTMVYKTIDRLVARELLNEIEAPEKDGKKSRCYRVHGRGHEVFRLAILSSKLLSDSKKPAVA